jgi:hypothetical protein
LIEDLQQATTMAYSSSLLTLPSSSRAGDESSWEEEGAFQTQSLASLRQLNKRAAKKAMRVQFKTEVEVVFRVDRESWKFKYAKEPLREHKRTSKNLENLKATYNDKLVNIMRKNKAVKA